MNIIFFETLDSTNNYCRENIDALDDKTVVLASEQTAGRGRFDRAWMDLGSENIYMSIVLKPSENMAGVYSNLTQYLSVVLCHELEEMGLKPNIKWPNDVLLNEKKVCGILAEAIIKGEKLKGIILGIGINLNARSDQLFKIDKPATAVNLEFGRHVDKSDFMQKLLKKFFIDYERFLAEGFVFIKDDYEKRATFLNNELTLRVFNRVERGFASSVSDNGELVLVCADGNKKIINMGEVV